LARSWGANSIDLDSTSIFKPPSHLDRSPLNRSNLVAKFIAPIAATLFASAAFAHPSLVSSSPADKSQVAAPATIELKFSETLVPQFSAANLIMTGCRNAEPRRNEGQRKRLWR
jgi:methionine-rich copper-binding protein CopC